MNYSENWQEYSLDSSQQYGCFCADGNFKMAATVGITSTLDLMVKWIENVSKTIQTWLNPNCQINLVPFENWHFLHRSKFQDGHHHTTKIPFENDGKKLDL